ncbi:hypothetical protein [Nocardioides albus]|uniref:Uncharacterized protein n=1 Tax=Nocardioides albus TaxID=1841 RepID=A0A7W5FAW8_9ACTN|nr:hypothetical protein [Nocardioides albus]MBB3091719.1 hypothetical protein [Nocardioides albus]GGU44393.1 hypothetical protein GCM10007979_49320 [Nocardioides albus]
MTTDGADALAVLNSWFEARGRDTSASTLDAWSISRHKDAWVFSPGGGRRTNRLHMVRNGLVVAYSPSTEPTDAAYARMKLEAANTFGPAGPEDIAGTRRHDLPDGTYYYLEERDPPLDFGPVVLRATVTDGYPQDEHWSLQEKTWIPSQRLNPYRTGRGRLHLFRAPKDLAERWRTDVQRRWDAENDEAPALSGRTPDEDAAAERAKSLLKELQSFPGWSGISFRGMSAAAEFGKTANTAVARGLVATSRDSRVATENFTTPGVYAVMGTEGRGIESVSRHPKEFEVLFLPGTAFGIVGTIDVDGYPVILVHQAKLPTENPDIDMADFKARARNAVASGRAGAQVPITSPGKFIGDID